MNRYLQFAKKGFQKLCNPYFRAKTHYIKYYEKLPLKEDVILLESQHGENASGNIFYLAKELCRPEYDRFTVYFVMRNKKAEATEKMFRQKGMEKIQVVSLASKEYFRLLATAKYLVNDTTFSPSFIKKEGQVYLNTWHGTPLKTLGKKVNNDYENLGNVQKNFVVADYLLYPNTFTKEHLLKDYMLANISGAQTVLGGYPRNCAFFDRKGGERLRKEMGTADKKVYAYLPTFRGTPRKAVGGKADAYMQYYLYQLDEMLDENEILYVNLHPLTRQAVGMEAFSHIRPFPEEMETYEFLNSADCLITDYSSVFFDFAVTGKKIVLFPFDKEDYFRERGTYFGLDELPFPQAFTPDELLAEIRCGKNYDDTAFLEKFCPFEGADAAKNLCRLLLYGEKSGLIVEKMPNNGKKNILFYGGDLANNGITTSLRNLLMNVDPEKYNYYFAFRSENVTQSRDNIRSFPDEVGYVAMMGDMNLTIAEKVIRVLFKRKLFSAGIYAALMKKRIGQECQRLFGKAIYDTVIQFNGYEQEMILLFGHYPGKRAIYVHNNMVEEIRLKKNQRQDVLHWAYRRYDKVALVTEDMRAPTKQLCGQDKNFVVCRNIIDYKEILKKAELPFAVDEKVTTVWPSKDHLFRMLEEPGQRLINIGRFSPEKGQIRLLEAFAQLHKEHPDSRLIIMGGNSNKGHLEKVKKKAEQLKLQNDVVLILNMPNPFPLLKQCDGFVLSSLHEGFGLVLAEADILGVPVVSTEIPGPTGFMKKHGGFLVEDSQEGVYDGICRLYHGEIKVLGVDYEQYNRQAVAETMTLFE